MRARNVKPGFFSNHQLGTLPPLARLLFIGLWCLADREGRLDENGELIKVQVFPYEKRISVAKLLLDLASKKQPDGSPSFIRRYEVNGQRIIEIVNFHRHQKPHLREAPSRLPAPPEAGAEALPKAQPKAQPKAGASPGGIHSLNPESGIHSLNPAPPSETARTGGGGSGTPPKNGNRGLGIIPGQVRDWSDAGAPAWIVAIGRRAARGEDLTEPERDALFGWSMGEEPEPVEAGARGEA